MTTDTITESNPKIERDTDLGGLGDLATYMKVGQTWMSALKKCATRRNSDLNPTPFSGNKSCALWIRDWMQRNRDFKASAEYPKKKQ